LNGNVVLMYYFVNPFHVFAVFKLKLSTFVCRAGLVAFSDHPCRGT